MLLRTGQVLMHCVRLTLCTSLLCPLQLYREEVEVQKDLPELRRLVAQAASAAGGLCHRSQALLWMALLHEGIAISRCAVRHTIYPSACPLLFPPLSPQAAPSLMTSQRRRPACCSCSWPTAGVRRTRPPPLRAPSCCARCAVWLRLSLMLDLRVWLAERDKGSPARSDGAKGSHTIVRQAPLPATCLPHACRHLRRR